MQVAFVEIEASVFTGKSEVLSVKVPKDLKKALKDYGRSRGRSLSEVVCHALVAYGTECQRKMRLAEGADE